MLNFQPTVYTLLVLLFLVSCEPTEPRLPNIVLIYADDMGYGDLSTQNPESKIPTPNLDELARQGLRFTDGHSSSGICTPSRFALLTGMYHWRRMHGIVQSFGKPVFEPQDLTIAEMLKEKGYRTACVGKWHLGWDWNILSGPSLSDTTGSGRIRKFYTVDEIDWEKPIGGGPLDQGFDYYFGDDVPNFPPYTWIENDRVVEVPDRQIVETPPTAEGQWEARPGPMLTGWRLDAVMPKITEKAVAWIEAQKGADAPFFLYFPLTAPHAPIVPTEEFKGTSRAGGYGDFMVQTDWTAGQVLAALEDHGFSNNTIVIFTSDNGPERYAYPRVRNFDHRSMGPLRGLKRDVWEGGHRVPFVVRWPGVIEPGTVSDETISQVDLLATLAAVTGYELPESAGVDSYNLLPVWKGDPYSSPIREATVQNTFAGKYAIRQGKWLFIDAPDGRHSKVPDWYEEEMDYSDNPHPACLYDLSTDIGQRHNLYQEHPEVVENLRSLLKKYREEGRSRP